MIRVLEWPACSLDLSPAQKVWRVLKHTHTHTQTCNKDSSVPLNTLRRAKQHLKHLMSWRPRRREKEWQHYKVLKALLSRLILECVSGPKCRNGWRLTNEMELTGQNVGMVWVYTVCNKIKVHLRIAAFFLFATLYSHKNHLTKDRKNSNSIVCMCCVHN